MSNPTYKRPEPKYIQISILDENKKSLINSNISINDYNMLRELHNHSPLSDILDNMNRELYKKYKNPIS